MNNRYGVDTSYFRRKLQLVIRDIENARPDELARCLLRLARVANAEVFAGDEFADLYPGYREKNGKPDVTEMTDKEIDDIIYAMANEGHSREATREYLGVSHRFMRTRLPKMDPQPNWRRHGSYINNIVANKCMKGIVTPEIAETARHAARAWSEMNKKEHRGFTGSVEQIIKHFGYDISSCTVRRRIANGMPPDEAFSKPRTPPAFTTRRVRTASSSAGQFARPDER